MMLRRLMRLLRSLRCAEDTPTSIGKMRHPILVLHISRLKSQTKCIENTRKYKQTKK